MTKKQFDRWVESHYYDCVRSTGITTEVIESLASVYLFTNNDVKYNYFNYKASFEKHFIVSLSGKRSKTLRIINMKTGKTGYSSVDTTTETFDIFIGIAIAWARYCGEEIPTEIEEDTVEQHYLTIDDFKNMKYGTRIRVIGDDGKPSFPYTFVAMHPAWENVIIFVKGYGITDDMNIDDCKIILDEPVEVDKQTNDKEHYLTWEDFTKLEQDTKLMDSKTGKIFMFRFVKPSIKSIAVWDKNGPADAIMYEDNRYILFKGEKPETKKEVKHELEEESEVKYLTWIDFMNMNMAKGTCFTTAFEGNKEVYKFLYVKDAVQGRFCASDSMSRKVTFTFAENQYVPYKVTTDKNTEFEHLYYTLEDFNKMEKGTIIRSAVTHEDYTFVEMIGNRDFVVLDKCGRRYLIYFKPNTYF